MSGREPGSGGEGDSRLRLGIYGLVALASAAALFCVLNPWFEEWSAAGTVFLVFLYRVEPWDPLVTAAAPAGVATVLLAAVADPTRRTVRIDPAEALSVQRDGSRVGPVGRAGWTLRSGPAYGVADRKETPP